LKKNFRQEYEAYREEGIETREGLLDLKIRIRTGQLYGSGKGNREAILAEFFEGELGDLGECVALKDIHDGIADSEQSGGRPLYSSSARRTFCIAGRALRAACRT
jgi:hypothetical protein